MTKITESYVRERFGADLAQEKVDALRGAMQKYENNHWWEQKDPVEIARYQIFEDIFMSDFSTFHEGVEKLIGRPVYTHEFGLNVEGVRQEAREAIARMEGKTGTLDDKVAAERELNGIKTLTDYAARTGKRVVVVGNSKKE